MWLSKSTLCVSLLFAASPVLAETAADTTNNSKVLSLKKIMADPDWMGNAPSNPRWSLDGTAVFYSQKAQGHSHQNQFKVQLEDKKVVALADDEALYLASQQAEKNQSGTNGVFAYQGDLFLIEFSSGKITRFSSDDARQSNPRFVSDEVISYFEGRKIFLYEMSSGLARQIADFKTTSDPEQKASKSYLEQSQPRLLSYIEKTEKEKDFQAERRKQNKISQSKTWYLGEGIDINTFRLSPDANWLILGTIKKSKSGKADNMPEFVTADGYVNNRNVRPLVGTSKPTNETFYLIDLKNQQKYPIDTDNLPGINDDPLADLKKDAAKKIGYKYKELQEPRAIYAHNWTANRGVEWSDNSNNVALLLYSYDNKDRWIVGLDVNKRKLKTLHWMSDDAWINDWTFNEFGWLPDNQTLYYVSEEDGYAHLYIKKGKRRARQLTEGEYEVSNVTVSKDGQALYFKANKKHPGIYEIYKVSLKGKLQALTDLGGVNDYVLSPDETKLLIRHSTTTRLPELYLKALDSEQPAEKITDTASAAFKAVEWQKPEIVEVPSSHIKRSIYSRFYQAKNNEKVGANNKKPAVIFVHGAGYLQNSHQGWSGYFREYMFHNMLTERGYVVLDMDYRASKGYGRDWRTAIYRQMGTPELEDLTDGAKWLVDNANVDPQRIGIYGGSYGGFMTFMALFKSPEVFAAGAALRPVTDWAHYNHGYTSNILNTPRTDPDAYEKSSPIEFAEGLNKPLLIAHGMVDDNVFFKDTVRLVQRLIELEKTPYFETAIYPVEPHSFRQPSSWLDEYTRIYQLFERNLNEN
ncbi:S9 family peptidase [Aliikangiella coralliicola]|uniref:S9 family peptidase n=1 Tax=Aliikangiella coralliicola TaxID=2592383 RepID=A0A545UBP0_9GAMM|nr:prolyl oligopeptidase family serine peptidase [Aliikangiella coralliicola]TQV86885.1 S9 family peptidase [Aliikangiella coralliicola]